MSIAAAFAADKPSGQFKPGPASSYPNHQTNDNVTIGAETYVSGEKVKAAFSKVDPYQNGVLPVLIVIQNDSAKAINLEGMRAEYIGPNRDRVYATPAKEVRYLKGPNRPRAISSPAGTKILKEKNPLADPLIEMRSFAAKMLPAGQSAYGFLYFDTGMQQGATLYITGLKEASTGQDLLFFELTLQ